MANNPLKIMITRPAQAGRNLQLQLEQLGMSAYCQPFFDYQAKDNKEKLQTLLAKAPTTIVIFVSVAAVEFAEQVLPITTWQAHTVIAVGHATQRALANRNIKAIAPIQHDSEGILALPQLQTISEQQVIIVRGDGGRELIAEQLKLRGAKVDYFESYRRIWLAHDQHLLQQWQQQQINCIIVTSNALLESIVQLMSDNKNYWQQQCLWIVASERIANNAKNYGMVKVINAKGASDLAIIKALTDNQ